MSIENVSLSALVAAIRARADESRALKRRLRQPWTEPMADAQRALVRCRRQTTRLLILRAWLRGRLHLVSPPRDGWSPTMTWDRERHHRLVAETVARDFILEEAS